MRQKAEKEILSQSGNQREACEIEQVARQPAMEAIPLVMEPESRFYADPVIVLDFQSLYPSIVIAYNLCFSTCLGRPAHAASDPPGPQLGCSCLNLPPAALQSTLAPDKYAASPSCESLAASIDTLNLMQTADQLQPVLWQS